jgi:hypothetical protein
MKKTSENTVPLEDTAASAVSEGTSEEILSENAVASEGSEVSAVSGGASEGKASEKTAPKKRTKSKLAQIDMNELIEVRSCVYGCLYYKSRAGYTVTWSDFGIVQILPASELLIMRNEQPAFFVNNWIAIVADNAREIIEALQLERYYKDISFAEDMDEIFDYNPDELKAALGKMNAAMKETVARRAYALIQEGTLDSHKAIEMLERVFNIELQ